MEFFRDANFPFMRLRRYFIAGSIALVVLAIVLVFVHGQLNIGIDFAGGTQITLRFTEEPRIDDLRRALADAGITDAQIQRFGGEAEHEVMIRARLSEGAEAGRGVEILAALDREYNQAVSGLDLNRVGADALANVLVAADPDALVASDAELAAEHYARIAADVLEIRRQSGVLTSLESLFELPGVSEEVRTAITERVSLGHFALLGEESVGPQIGSELRKKGILAVVFSLIGMLAYIWLRFELRFGVGALVALLHDVTITLGLYAVLDYEFNLPTIAAFLTLVGYSVNDTVVVFDRVRENLQKNPRADFEGLLNHSLNQTLSRTVLTSGTTLLAVTALYVLGGDVLRGFAFVLLVGVIVGTYSSIFIASPVTLAWERALAKRNPAAKTKRKAQPASR